MLSEIALLQSDFIWIIPVYRLKGQNSDITLLSSNKFETRTTITVFIVNEEISETFLKKCNKGMTFM